MPRKPAPADPALEALARVREDPASEASLRELRRALRGTSPRAAARAARIAAEASIATLVPDLREAFGRLLAAPAKADPGCAAKAAIAETLDRLEDLDPAAFLHGIRHVQREPVWGGTVDTAVELRGICALALARLDPPDALLELGRLLADPEPPARVNAARALAARGGDDALPLLHLRVLAGDPEAEVLGECFAAALRLAPDRSLDFVAGYLEARGPAVAAARPAGAEAEAVAEAAALALGGSRHPRAFALLREWCGRLFRAEARRTALVAIALLRSDQALDWLLGLVREGTAVQAREAIEALGTHRGDGALEARVREAAAERAEPELGRALARAFG